jgi:hypothetical protein
VIAALALFCVISSISCIVIMAGPIAHVKKNSHTYSAVPPARRGTNPPPLPPSPHCPKHEALKDRPVQGTFVDFTA